MFHSMYVSTFKTLIEFQFVQYCHGLSRVLSQQKVFSQMITNLLNMLIPKVIFMLTLSNRSFQSSACRHCQFIYIKLMGKTYPFDLLHDTNEFYSPLGMIGMFVFRAFRLFKDRIPITKKINGI